MDNEFVTWWQNEPRSSVDAGHVERAFAAGRAAERDDMAKANGLIEREIRRLARHSVAAEQTIAVLQRQMESALAILSAEDLIERFEARLVHMRAEGRDVPGPVHTMWQRAQAAKVK